MNSEIEISAIIIAKNEEYNIGRCLESLKDCIEDIVVLVDDQTNDKTIEIIRTFPAVRFYVINWKGYAKTKQYAVSLTKNEWILWIDADEALTDKLKTEINNFKTSVPKHSAYSMPRKAYFLGKWIKHCGWYPGRVTRLFKKKKAQFSDKQVHEHLVVDGSIGEFSADLNHFTDPDIKHYFKKFNEYTSLAAEDLLNGERKFKIFDLIFRPAIIFIKMYFIKLGFLDGIEGFILSIFSSLYVFTKYCKFWELKKGKTKNGNRKSVN